MVKHGTHFGNHEGRVKEQYYQRNAIRKKKTIINNTNTDAPESWSGQRKNRAPITFDRTTKEKSFITAAAAAGG